MVGLLIMVWSSLAQADDIGAQWLSRIDAAASVEDAHMLLDLVVTDSSGEQATREIEIWQSGDEQRLVRMTAPARLKGVGLLVTHGDALHLFLPRYPPARRVVGNSRADAFMGTDFAIDDLSRLQLADDYEAEVLGEDGDLTRLLLNPTARDDETSLKIWVGSDNVIRKLEHLDADGAPTRRITMTEIQDVGGVMLAHDLMVEDLQRFRTTRATLRNVTVNQGVDEGLFTVSNLENP